MVPSEMGGGERFICTCRGACQAIRELCKGLQTEGLSTAKQSASLLKPQVKIIKQNPLDGHNELQQNAAVQRNCLGYRLEIDS